jgi:hypothetical protein
MIEEPRDEAKRADGEGGTITIRKPLKAQAPSPFIGHFAHFNTTEGELDLRNLATSIFRS